MKKILYKYGSGNALFPRYRDLNFKKIKFFINTLTNSYSIMVIFSSVICSNETENKTLYS